MREIRCPRCNYWTDGPDPLCERCGGKGKISYVEIPMLDRGRHKMKLELAGATINLHKSGLTVSKYPWGEVKAFPQDNAEYRARAKALGYGADSFHMSRDHEVAHHLIAHWLGLDHSPTIAAVARNQKYEYWQDEEAAVLAIQRLAQVTKVDLLELAKEISDASKTI